MPVSAILLIVGSVGCFAVLDSIVKFLAMRYPVPLLVWARYAVQALAIVLWLGPTMRLRLLRTERPRLQIARGTTVLLSSLCFFNALKFLPLAEATAINYTTPTLVILLSVLVLKERMTWPRWAFVAAGMTGMLLVVRPGAAILHGAALLALVGAGFYATFQIMTRKLSAEDPRVTLFYSALCGTVLMTLLLPFVDRDVDMPWSHVVLVAIMGMLGTAGHFLFILAFRHAPASGAHAVHLHADRMGDAAGLGALRPVSRCCGAGRDGDHRGQRAVADVARAPPRARDGEPAGADRHRLNLHLTARVAAAVESAKRPDQSGNAPGSGLATFRGE